MIKAQQKLSFGTFYTPHKYSSTVAGHNEVLIVRTEGHGTNRLVTSE